MKWLLPLLFLTTLLAPSRAFAIYLTSKELNQGCLSDAPKETAYCLGYIAGVIDYHVMMQSLGTTPTIDFCMPDNLSIQKAAIVVLTYLKKAPQNNDFIAAPAVTMAMHANFPCAAPARKRK
jgi:hypothetical protein